MNNQVAIDMLQPGDVLVVDLFGKVDGGTMVGDNLFYYIMKTTKSAGMVVDGAIRDLQGDSEMDMPAYFRKAHPSAIADVTLTGINIPIRIGNVTVLPGDGAWWWAIAKAFILCPRRWRRLRSITPIRCTSTTNGRG